MKIAKGHMQIKFLFLDTIISFKTKSKLNREKMKKIAGKQKGKSLRQRDQNKCQWH